MSKKLMTTAVLVFAFGAALPALPAGAAPPSPGACNMMHTSANGMAGMGNASDQGLGNMMALVAASEAAGCSP
jgi:hypothetical protein